MRLIKRILSGTLLCATLCTSLALPINAATAPLQKSEDFESYSEDSTYPSSKLWGENAKFYVWSEDRNQYLHMPFVEENCDAAIVPFTGKVDVSQKTILVKMDLRPVYTKGNPTSQYNFRVRNYNYTDDNGKTLSGKWKNFFTLNVEDTGTCSLVTSTTISDLSPLPLVHGEWNSVFVSLNLVEGTYTVSANGNTILCDFGHKNISFQLDQLQFNQLQKDATYCESKKTANYVDIDNVSITSPEDVSRFDNIFQGAPQAEMRTDATPDTDTVTAGIRFRTRIDSKLMEELVGMKASGTADSVTVGTLIAPTDYLTHTPLALGLPAHARLDVATDFPNVYYSHDTEQDLAYLAGSISKLRETNFGRDFTARAYVSVVLSTGQHFIVYSDTVTVAANSLSKNALADTAATWSTAETELLRRCEGADNAVIGEELRLMSYNIYYSDLREERMQNVVDMIKRHDPDLIGIQEATDEDWKPFLQNKLGEEYACVGHGREKGSVGEGTPILYRKDKFTLLREGTYWLSDTPEVWSKHEGSRQSRIFTYVLLSRNSDGKEFVLVNTHLDTKGPDIRILQIESLKKQIRALGLDEYPLLLTGDMNSRRDSESGEIDHILSFGFTDSFDLAIKHDSSAMENGNHTKIDYCFVEREHALVTNYACDKDAPNGDASDHAPVFIDFRLKP